MSRNLRILSFLGLALAILAVLYVAIARYLKKNTPIVIVGGSIDGMASQGWTALNGVRLGTCGSGGQRVARPSNGYFATPTTNNVDYVRFEGFTSNPPKAFTGTGGWTVTYFTRNHTNATLSTDVNCSDTLDGKNQIYFQADPRFGRMAEVRKNGQITEIDFHENSCAPSDIAHGPLDCDQIEHIEIETRNNIGMPKILTCPGVGCNVKIGEGN